VTSPILTSVPFFLAGGIMTDLKITEVGLECGFSDHSHFSRVFSHHVELRQVSSITRGDANFSRHVVFVQDGIEVTRYRLRSSDLVSGPSVTAPHRSRQIRADDEHGRDGIEGAEKRVSTRVRKRVYARKEYAGPSGTGVQRDHSDVRLFDRQAGVCADPEGLRSTQFIVLIGVFRGFGTTMTGLGKCSAWTARRYPGICARSSAAG